MCRASFGALFQRHIAGVCSSSERRLHFEALPCLSDANVASPSPNCSGVTVMPRGTRSSSSSRSRRVVRHSDDDFGIRGEHGRIAARRWAAVNRMSGGARGFGLGGDLEEIAPARRPARRKRRTTVRTRTTTTRGRRGTTTRRRTTVARSRTRAGRAGSRTTVRTRTTRRTTRARRSTRR